MLIFIALAAKHRRNLFKSDTKQAFLNRDMGEEKICFRLRDWWPEKVPARLRFAAHEEDVWDSAGGETVAREDLDVDGGALLPSV